MNDHLGDKGGAPTPFVNSFDHAAIGSLRYNTSQQGQPITIVYGTQRVSVNILEFFNYQGGSSKGGKGGLTDKSGKKQANFSVFVAMAVCQGPVNSTGASHGVGGQNRIWANAGIAYGLGAVGLNGYAGNDGQNPDPTFLSEDPNVPVIGYSGTAYLTGTPLQLGQSPALPNISVEVSGIGSTSNGGPGFAGAFPDDANPAFIAVDVISNTRYGAYFPSGNIDSAGTIADFGNYCVANSLAMSLILDRCQPAARWVEEVCELTVAAPFWSSNKFKIVPYAVFPATGNGVTWTPDLTVQYSVVDRDFIDWGGQSDPVIVNRVDPTQLTNWIGMEYMDSNNGYNPNIAYTFDQGAIDLFGLRNQPPKQAHGFTNVSSATSSCKIQLQRTQQIRNKYKFQLNWTFSLLEPMDIIEITDANAGLNAVPVRILSVTENDNMELQFEAEEIPAFITTPPSYATNTPSSRIPDVNALPPNVNTPIIFEPKPPLSYGLTEVWMLGTGLPSDWGGANVFASTDGTTYTFLGQIFVGSQQGLLTANLPAYGGANPDNTNTLSVNLTESGGTLISGSAADASNGITLCYVDGELLAYQTATLTSPGHYNLTTLYRGLNGTSPGGHLSGSQFAFLGTGERPGVLKYAYSAGMIGLTISLKFQSFNTFFNQAQDISGLTVYTYTLNGEGSIAPVNVPFSFNGIPQNTVPILNYTFGAGDSFPTNFSGSVCTAGTGATVNTPFTMKKNGTIFGTMTFSAGFTAAVFAAPLETFTGGDILTIVPTRTDATLSNLTGNLAGTT